MNTAHSPDGRDSFTEVRRRDFLYVATGTMAGVGILASAWPFIDQMEPTSAALSAGMPISVDLSPLGSGQQVVVFWRAHPVFIVHRTADILRQLKASSLISELRDPHSEEFQQPSYAKNWCRSLKPEYLVVVGICTHLGCIPTFMPGPGSVGSSWPGGYLCHCHGSKYDLAGRVFKGVPAPYNLPVPPYSFSNNDTLVIGQNPAGESFELSQIQQI
jgi:ubiquinol-cytochrome c reductase iron-sulfur subunit